MKKTVFGLLLFATVLLAEVTNLPVTIDFVKSNKIKIIDIRTQSEWREMGIIDNAYLLTFFDEESHYNVKDFIAKLNKIVQKDEQFALICNTSSRTKLVSNLLGNKLDYNVINLIGGMDKLIKDGYRVTLYPKKNVIVQSMELNSSSEPHSPKSKIMEEASFVMNTR